MELINQVYDSVSSYFNNLKHTGYKPYNEVNKLLVLIYIQEFLDKFIVTEEEYKIINDALYCLYGNCMIPYPDYKKAVSEIVYRQPDKYRLTEDDILRFSDTLLRVKS